MAHSVAPARFSWLVPIYQLDKNGCLNFYLKLKIMFLILFFMQFSMFCALLLRLPVSVKLSDRSLCPSGDGEIRTHDPLLARQVLSQLSYTPVLPVICFPDLPAAFLTVTAVAEMTGISYI